MTVCPRETTPTLHWLQAVRKQREAAQRHAAPLSNKVYKVPILIKREKVLFLRTGYRGTFLVSVYRATLVTINTRTFSGRLDVSFLIIISPFGLGTLFVGDTKIKIHHT